MVTQTKCINLILILILTVGLLTGCSGGNKPVIDTSELQFKVDGLELLGAEIEVKGNQHFVVTTMKNNSGNKINIVGVHLKQYDESEAVIGTRPGFGEHIDPGEEFKVQMSISKNNDVSKIKVTEISLPGE